MERFFQDGSPGPASRRDSALHPTEGTRGEPIAGSNYAFTQGDFDVLVLSDGYISLPDHVVIPDASAPQRRDLLHRLDAADGMVRLKANIPVIRRGDDVILVDIGAGQKYQSTDGQLMANLLKAGIEATDVSRVVFTHAHPDHIWATIAPGGNLSFPNTTYYVGGTEWDYWMGPDDVSAWPADLQAFAAGARRDLEAIKDRVVILAPGDAVVEGLTALDTAGHTPGHVSLELAGDGGLIITADVIPHEIVSFEHPAWRFGYDMVPDLAIRSRGRLLDRAATDRLKLLGFHWPYPGVGYATRSGGGFRFAKAT